MCVCVRLLLLRLPSEVSRSAVAVAAEREERASERAIERSHAKGAAEPELKGAAGRVKKRKRVCWVERSLRS